MRVSEKQRITVDTHNLQVTELVIGRTGGPGVQVGLDDEYVSTRHLALSLTKRAGHVQVDDLGSTNGTYVNGRKMLGVVVLAQGTHQLRIGHTDIELLIT